MAARGCSTADGTTLLRMLESAADRLAVDAGALDALNVFPVPDGDTGTNLLLTVRAALAAATATIRPGDAASPPPTASAMSAAIARGALEGARGNSGIILSQFFRGLAAVLEGRDLCAPADLAAAFARAEALARAGISNPTEGTILTVLGDVARALADDGPVDGSPLAGVLRRAVTAAAASVERTPSLLAVLREAGVVDAGARGMQLVLEGFLGAVGDGAPSSAARRPTPVPRPAPRDRAAASFGWCTEFLLVGEALPQDLLRTRLESEGSSVILAGDARTTRVHLHTARPEAVVAFARTLGTVSHLETRDLDRQCEDAAALGARDTSAARVAVVALLDGEGFAAVARGLGAAALTGGFDRARDGVGSGEVILVTGCDAAREAVRGARAGAGVEVRHVAARDGPACIAALFAFRPDLDAAENVAAMSAAASRVRTLGVPTGAGDPASLLADLLRDAGEAGPVDAVTVYRGTGADARLGGLAADACRAALAGADVQVVFGGQAEPLLLVSLE